MNEKRLFPLYPLLFALHPILHLYASNVETTRPIEVLRPTIAVLLFALVLLVLAKAVFRDPDKAAVGVSIFLFLFFSYGSMLATIKRGYPTFMGYSLSRLVFGAWLLLLMVIFAAMLRTRRNLAKAAPVLTIFGLALVCIPAWNLLSHQFAVHESRTAGWHALLERDLKAARQFSAGARPRPDIYYIILDMYARDDVLKNKFGYDNTPFVRYLMRKGFYVARHSRCNYPFTGYSIPSSLNFDYFDTLWRGSKSGYSEGGRREMIWNNRMAGILRAKGYRYVYLDSTWNITAASPYADMIIPPRRSFCPTEIERVLIDSSVLGVWSSKTLRSRLNKHLRSAFDSIAEIAQMKGPTFTFAHIVSPHDPFVFDRNGNLPPKSPDPGVSEDDYRRKLYTDQIHYLNKLLVNTIDRILAKSETPPVIILQADHGAFLPEFEKVWTSRAASLTDKELKAGFKDRMCILNAYYLPGNGTPVTYDTISPVNLFRIVLNRYLGARYKLLKDVIHIPQARTLSLKPLDKANAFD